MKEFFEYREAIVSFIDILGFKDIVANKTALDVYDICQLFRSQYQTPDLTNAQERSGIQRQHEVHFFSDSVVRIKYVDDIDTDTAFNPETEEVMSLALMQYRLIREGVLVRGGVCRGKIFSDPSQNVLFGPALIDAYKLENTLAVNPRIIITKEIWRGLISDMFSSYFWVRKDSSGNSWQNLIKNMPNFDEPWWINYFWGTFCNGFTNILEAIALYHAPEIMQKNMLEPLVCEQLLILDEIGTKFVQKPFVNERIKAKYAWIYDLISETIKDIHAVIYNYEKNHLLTEETRERLQHAASCHQGLNE